jgi:hypothetical protein
MTFFRAASSARPMTRFRNSGVNFINMIKRRFYTRALRKTFFSKIFVFASFGNSRFSNFGNILVISVLSERFRTRKKFAKNCEKLRKIAKNCKNSRKFVFVSFGNSLLLKLPKITKNDV